MKWKSWGSSYHSEPAGVFSEHLFCKWGQNIFPLSLFEGGGIILKLWLAERAYTCVRLHWPTTIKIDSNGIWWLTHCLNLEKKKKRGKKQHTEKHKDSHTLSNYTQGWAPMHLPSGGQLELRWKKKSTLEYIYSVRLLLKHTWLRKADTATCMLPLIILFTSLLDLKGHFTTGPLPRKQEDLGQRGSWQLSDGLLVISTMFRGFLRGSEGCSHSAQCNYPDMSLIIVKPNFLSVS